MTGQALFEQALSLLNYPESDAGGSGLHAVRGRGLACVNRLYRDLWYTAHEEAFVPLATLADEVALPERVAADILPYGVAMLLAAGEGDADNQALFATLYNQKRALLTRTEARQDTLPRMA